MARNRFEKRRDAIDQAIREHIDQYKGIYKKADGEDRDPSDDERLDIENHLRAIETLKTEREDVEANIKTLEHVDDLGRKLGPAVSVGDEPHDRMFRQIDQNLPIPAGYGHTWGNKTLGQAFVESKGYKSIVQAYRESGGQLPSGFTTGPVALEAKGTLLEGAGAPGAGSGGGFIPAPQVIPGAVQQLFQPLTFANLLLEGQTTTNTLRYVVEGTATSGAAGVPEGGTKPESTLGLGTRDEPIKKIATVLPISDEMLEDAPAVQAYINGRLVLFVKIEEERQLLRGVAGGNEVQGILTSRGVPVYAGGTAVGNRADQLFVAMNGVRGSAFVEPEWIVMHPTDWQAIRLTKDTAQQYLGGGPFLGAYGNTGYSNPNSNQTSPMPADSIWNKAVYVTAAVGGAGTALVGSSASGQVWRRGGVSVEASNSHASYFTANLVAVRAEERLGLAIYRPSAYVEVRLS